MGDFEHAGTAKTMPAIRTETNTPAITTSENTAGEVAGEILADQTVKTPRPTGSEANSADNVANRRGMAPISRP